ncbi:TPA: hypothetical protein N0F65_000044 [Lagenidium giganteum]|uniref:Uncharacterized protein n=1 Tax=Lagenidium giganteum TaxID=4803 RepID=A0AAV2YS39_9STRA|nr:TPA: hypothetical protein N0F65_000044 [Lagenidium giganteum]
MRKWDILSEGGFEDAMTEYIGVVDKALPGWDDQPLDYPVSKQDKFWKDDAAVENCQHCGAMFGLQQRRHHCRLCFDIFCTGCCREELEVALCPGAPLRMQRVCASCFLDVERNQGLLEVRRMIRENHDMEQKIKEIQMSTEALMVAKQREEAKLREQAAACGCDLVALDNAIQKKIGSPVALVVKTPPAHKFTPRESLEAKQQLALANRQLFMALKGAQCRSKKALDKMDVTLTVLREAVCFGSSHWNVILRHARPFLTLRDIKRLGAVSLGFRTCLLRHKSDQRCIFEQGIAPSRLRMCVWQAECLSDSKTRAYVLDLAEALSATRVDSSDSDNDEDMPSRSANPTATPESSTSSQGKWRPHPVAPDSNREKRAYDVILNRCGADTQLEHDAQILSDVHRTFGASPLRKIKRKSYSARAMGMGNPTASLNGAPGATEVRQASLRNILRAFSSVNTEIGYCQGMDFVTALLLSVVDWNETKAFWLLTSLVASPRYQLEMLYCPGIPHLNLRCFQLERLTDQHLPELGAYLREIDFPVSMFATSWFMTLFTNMEMFPYDVVVRLVDGFLLAGWKHLFRVALVVLEALEHHILASAFEEIPQVFYNIQEVAVRSLWLGA